MNASVNSALGPDNTDAATPPVSLALQPGRLDAQAESDLLLDLARHLGTSEALSEHVVQAAARITDAAACAIWLHRDHTLTPVAGLGPERPRAADMLACIERNAPMHIPAAADGAAPREQLLIPIATSDGAVGALWLASHPARTFGAEDLRIASRLCSFAAEALALQRRCTSAERRGEQARARLAAAGIVFLTISADGSTVEDSPSWRSFTGQSMEDLQAGHWTGAFHPADRARHETAWGEALSQQRAMASECRVVRPDGNYTWCTLHASPVLDEHGAVSEWIVVVSDMSALKLAREQLEESESRLQATYESAPIGITETSLDGKLLRVNRAYCEITGYSREELFELSFQDITHPDDLPMNLELYRGLQAGEYPVYQMEKRFIHKDGHPVWVELTGGIARGADGTPRYGIAAIQDITARKQAEDALRDSERHMRLIAHALPVYILHCDTEFRYRFVNMAYASRFGMVPAQLIGRHIPEIVGEQGFLSVKHHLDRALTGEPVDYEALIPYREIGPRYMRSVNVPEFDSNGAVQGVISVLIDITDRKRMEEALRQSNQRKDEFLAMLAHELRNPLAPIRSATAVIKMLDAAREPQLQWAREVIERQSQHLARLVDDLLDVARITTGKVILQTELVELSDAVSRAVEISRPAIEERKHRLEVTLPPEPVYLEADLTRLTQVLGNLLSNAVKYTDEGGRISLDVSREDASVRIRVRDSGIGIPADILPHVFDLFTQADRTLDRAQGGLGIGLTLVDRLVKMHGGSVSAHSEGPGRGSEFIVRLPVVSTGVQAGDERAGDGAANGRTGHAILIVDDNVDGARTLEVLLAQSGHRVRVAHEGVGALTMATTSPPDIVILDIGLPGMNGYELARRFRELPQTRGALLIALTGYGRPEDRQRSAQAGFDHHLVKPVEPDVLEALLSTMPSQQQQGTSASNEVSGS